MSSPRFWPFVAYAVDDVDDGLRASGHDGEPRLAAARAFLRALAAEKDLGLRELLTAGAPANLACELLPDPALSTQRALLQGLLAPDAPPRHAPRVRLLAPTCALLAPHESDALPEAARRACVPVADEALLLAPGTPPGAAARAAEVVLTWRRSFTETAAAVQLRVCRAGPAKVELRLHPAEGAPRTLVTIEEVPPALLAPLFAPGGARPEPDADALLLRMPTRTAHLPDVLVAHLANALQDSLRLHVLLNAALPDGTARPLALNRVLVDRPVLDGVERLRLRAYVHPSSVVCACPAHRLGPAASAQVVVDLQMCGRAVKRGDGGGRCCPLHQHATRRQPLAPDRCCAGLRVSVRCQHGPSDGRGLCVPFDRLDHGAEHDLAPWLGLAADFADALQEHLGSEFATPAAEREAEVALLRSLQRRATSADEGVVAAQRARGALSERVMATRDEHALALLRANELMQSNPYHTARTLLPACRAAPLSSQEKQIAKTHFCLFPRFCRTGWAKRPAPDGPEPPPLPPPWKRAAAAAAAASAPEAAAAPGRVRKREEGYEYRVLRESIRLDGFAEVQRQLRGLDHHGRSEGGARKLDFLRRFLTAIKANYVLHDPTSPELAAMEVDYRQAKREGGRIYATNLVLVKDPSHKIPKGVSAQTMSSVLRPFLFPHCRDIDQRASQISIIVAAMGSSAAADPKVHLRWPDARAPPPVESLLRWLDDREGVVREVCEEMGIAEDYAGRQKEVVKQLLNRLLFGGTVRAWVRFTLGWTDPDAAAHVARWVQLLETEMTGVVDGIFASSEWSAWCVKDLAYQRRLKPHKTEVELRRSTFALWAQKQESVVLDAMLAYCHIHGWTVESLIFDGMLVRDEPARTLDLRAMEAHVRRETGYCMEIVEKDNFKPPDAPWPAMALQKFR